MFCKYCGRTIEAPEKPCCNCGKTQGTLCSTDGYFGILQEVLVTEKGIDMQNEEGKTPEENFYGNKEEIEKIVGEAEVQKNTIRKMQNEINAFKKSAEKLRCLGLIIAAFWLMLAGSVFFQIHGQRIQKREISDIKVQEDTFEARIIDSLTGERKVYEQKTGEFEQKIGELEQKVNELEKQVQNKEVLQKQIEKLDKQIKELQKGAEKQKESIKKELDSQKAEIEEATTTVKKESGAEDE